MPKPGLSLFTLAVLIVISVVIVQKDLVRYYSVLAKNDKTADDIILEMRRGRELKKEIEDLKKNDRIEDIARSKLMLIKKGERPYRIIP